MSYAAERWARAQTAGNARAKAVLIELAHCMNSKTGQCTPSVAYLSSVTELKPDTVTKATNDLQERGLIVKTVVKTKNGRGCSYSFVSFVPSEWGQPENGHIPENGDTPESVWMDTPKNGEMGIPKNGVTHIPENGDRTGNKNREIEQRNRTEKLEAQDAPEVSLVTEEKTKRTILKKPDGVSDDLWDEWKKFRRNKRLSITERVLNNLTSEAEKAGLTIEQAMNIQLDREWRGFKAEWVKNKQPQQHYGFHEKKQEERHYELW